MKVSFRLGSSLIFYGKVHNTLVRNFYKHSPLIFAGVPIYVIVNIVDKVPHTNLTV